MLIAKNLKIIKKNYSIGDCLKKKSLWAVFLAAFIVIGLFFVSNADFGIVEGTSTYIIYGYIHDPTGTPISGAYAYLINSMGSSFGSGQWSSPSGFYYLSAPPGTYRLVVSSQSGATYSEANILLESDIYKNVTLVSGFKISGYVLDSSGNGVAGASTSISNQTWSVPSVTTDSSGYYSVYAPTGVYTFIIWPPLNSNLVNHESSVVVNSDMTKDVTLVSGYKISGYVRYPSGETVSGVSTRLTSSTGASYSSGRWSGSSGFYSLAAPAGTYQLTARGLSGTNIIYSETEIELSNDLTKDIVLIGVSISPSSSTMNVGQNFPFTASASGGSETYSIYEWYVNGVANSAQTNPTFNFSPISTGAYTISAVVIDNSGAKSTRSTVSLVMVNSALVAPDISASNVMLDQSQTSVLSSTGVLTGTLPYFYQWYSKAPNETSYSPIEGATLPTYSFETSSSTTVGVWKFVLNVTDSATIPVTVSSAEAQVTVNPPPTVAVSPPTAVLNVGSSVILNALASGGSGSLSYQWFIDNVAVGTNSSSYAYTATSGLHTIYVRVTDSANPPLMAISPLVTVTVNPALAAPTISASKTAIVQGQTTSLTSTAVSTGTSPYTYQWLVKPAGEAYSPIIGATLPDFSFATSESTVAGIWTFMLQVTDSATTPVTVTSQEIAVALYPVPKVEVVPKSVALNAGQSQLFTAVPRDGSGTYTGYQWYVNGSVQTGQTGQTFNHLFDLSGSYSVAVKVTDSLGATSDLSAQVTVTVNPALAAPTLTPSLPTVFQGRNTSLTTLVNTGTPAYTYKWYQLAPNTNSYSLLTGVVSSNYTFATSLSSSTGLWSFKVEITDATGATVNSTEVSVMLNPALTITVSPATVTLNTGQSQLFTASPTGGSGVYTSYQWYVNGIAQTGQTGATFNYSPATTGTYTITATVTDSSGQASPQSTTATTTVTTSPTPTPTPTTSPTPTPTPDPTPTPTSQSPTASPYQTEIPQQNDLNNETYIFLIFAVIIAIIVVVALALVSKRRNR